MILEHFHADGKIPDWSEELKIRERGEAIEWDVNLRNLEGCHQGHRRLQKVDYE